MSSLSRKGKSSGVAPVMNVTPLVDVVLVLLIIFMVILPAVNSELNIELAHIENADEERKGEPEPFVLSVAADEQLYFDLGNSTKRVAKDDLGDLLRTASINEPLRKLSVRGDRRLKYGQMRDIMMIVQDVGFPGVALRVSKTAVDPNAPLAMRGQDQPMTRTQ